MPIDKALVKRKFSLILEDLERLRPIADLTEDKFLADYHPQILAERLLERIIGRVIDINYHLITETFLVTPKDYADSFLKLADLNILSPSETKKFAKLSGLRNRLAHEYNGLDERLVFQALKEIISKLPSYLKAVDRFLSKS